MSEQPLVALDGGRAAAVKVTFDEKGRLVLPATPQQHDIAGHCAWLTAVFNLDTAHPVTAGVHEGLRGAAGHVVLDRLAAPPLRFEPASRINTPARLVEDLSWQMLPSDGAVHALKGEHCRLVAHVVRMLCGATRSLTDEQETAGLVGTFLQAATAVEGYTSYGSSGARYEAAMALQRDLDPVSGRPLGPAKYLIDANTGELVIPVSSLHTTARQYLGGSLARGWVDARIQNLGWKRARLDGHALHGRAGRQGPHARIDVYRGLLPTTTDETVTT